MPQSNPPESLPLRGQDLAGTSAEDPRPFDGKINLADYEPKWPYLFRREADRIRNVLGERVRGIEHVGSTAVPGLKARPCVDVLLTVADAADENGYLPGLESAGYSLATREPDWYGFRVLTGPDVNTNLHVFSEGAAEADRMLVFRDRLRASGDERGRYEQAKLTLAERRWDRVHDYAAAKSDIVEEILARSEDSAR